MEGHLATIDGSKFKAVNKPERFLRAPKLKRVMEEIQSSISRY